MQLPSAAYRFGSLALLAAAWWWLRTAHPTWMPGARDWLRSQPYLSDRSMALVSATIVAAFAVVLFGAFYNPWRTRGGYDDHLRSAVTFLILLILAAVAGLLAVAWVVHLSSVIDCIGVVLVLVSVQLIVSLVYECIKAMRKRVPQA